MNRIEIYNQVKEEMITFNSSLIMRGKLEAYKKIVLLDEICLWILILNVDFNWNY